MKKFLKAVAFVALASASMASNANIVINGSFEADSIGSLAWKQVNAVTGWYSVPVGDFEIQKGSDFGGLSAFNTAYHGTQYLELNTSHLTSISQSLATVEGGLYNLSLAYSGRLDTPGQLPSSMEIYWGGSKIATVKASYKSDWVELSFDNLLATGSNTSLVLKSIGPTAAATYGSLVDGVNVTQVVASIPEADSYAMMLAGLGLIGFIGRRRKMPAFNAA